MSASEAEVRRQTKRGARLLNASTARSRAMLFVAVFFTASAAGILFDVPRTAHTPLWSFAIYVVFSGVIGVGYIFASLWDLRLIPVLIGLNVALSMFGRWATAAARVSVLAPAEQHARLVLDTVACFICVALGYIFFVRFIHVMASSNSRLQTEMALARGIHEALVPTVCGQSGHVNYYGRSQASGAMGGDLVDVFEGPDGTTFYLVDVAGHGVGAGVLMAMLKSVARAALADGATLETLLNGLNRTVRELGNPGTFATCACLHISHSGQAHYALAGHLPILQRRATSGNVAELFVGGPMLGLQERDHYESEVVDAVAGDDFLIISDGLTEVFQRDGREFGMEGVRVAAFSALPATPKDLAEKVIAGAARYGEQLDDQTVLFVRIT
jgi:stage II sporulation SpoE-like protein